MKRYFLMFLAVACCVARADAQGTQEKIEAMKALSLFAKENCEEVSQTGDASSEKFKGNIDAGVSGLLKRFASAGASGTIEQETKKYSGVVQSQLPSALHDVRACKEHIIDLLKPTLLDSDGSKGGISETIYPGESPTPRNACSENENGYGITVIAGGNAFISPDSLVPLIAINGKTIVSMSRRPDGSIGINMDIIGADGRALVKIIENKFFVNPKNRFSIEILKSRLKVVSDDQRDFLDLEYLNPQAVRFSGTINYGGERVLVGKDATFVPSRQLTISGNCVQKPGGAAINIE